MKQMIFTAMILFCTAGFASAQTKHKGTVHKKTLHTWAKKTTKKSDTTVGLDNRKNYEWKNGQKATPTGNEATGVNDNGFTSGRKDSSSKRKVRRS